MTDRVRLANPEAAIRQLPRRSAVILRHPDPAERERLARHLLGICRSRDLRLMIAGDAPLANTIGAGGLHLPEQLLRYGRRGWRGMRRPGWLVTAAAHSPAAIQRAARAGVDAVLLSPVFATASHPGAKPLGLLKFARLVRQSPVPVYALGGISAATAPRLAGTGAAGFAAIDGLLAGQSPSASSGPGPRV